MLLHKSCTGLICQYLLIKMIGTAFINIYSHVWLTLWVHYSLFLFFRTSQVFPYLGKIHALKQQLKLEHTF